MHASLEIRSSVMAEGFQSPRRGAQEETKKTETRRKAPAFKSLPSRPQIAKSRHWKAPQIGRCFYICSRRTPFVLKPPQFRVATKNPRRLAGGEV